MDLPTSGLRSSSRHLLGRVTPPHSRLVARTACNAQQRWNSKKGGSLHHQQRRQIATSALTAADVEIESKVTTETLDATASNGHHYTSRSTLDGATAADGLASSNSEAQDSTESRNGAATVPTDASTSGQSNSKEEVVGSFRRNNGSRSNSSRPHRNGHSGRTDLPKKYGKDWKSMQRFGPIPPEEFPYKVGDTVVCTVVETGSRGWRVAIDGLKGVSGFCPNNELPHVLKTTMEYPTWHPPRIGMKREFLIKEIPEGMYYNGRGPLFSARLADLDIMWQRAYQLMAVCKEDKDNIQVHFKTTNTGGLLGVWQGIPVFCPWSYIPRFQCGEIKSKEVIVREYLGKVTPVSVADVDKKANRFVVNMIEALNNIAYEKIQVGDLLWGFVHGLESYGAFVTMEEYGSVRALLHVANMSGERIPSPEQLFNVGDRVRCVVVNIDKSSRRLSLSTAVLEENKGDMLVNKDKVYANAEKQAEVFRAWAALPPEERAPEHSDDRVASRGGSRQTDDLEWDSRS